MTGSPQEPDAQAGWRTSYRQGVQAVRAARLADATALLAKALAIAPDDEARSAVLTALAALERRRGRADRALRFYQDALAATPRSAGAAMDLGAALGDADRLAEAADAFALAGRLDPSSPGWRAALADTLNRLGRVGQAEQVARAGLAAHSHSPALCRALGASLQAQGRFVEAVDALQAALAVSPHDLDARFNLGVALKAQGLTDAAKAAFDRVLLQAPDHAAARLARTMAELEPFYETQQAIAASRAAYADALRRLVAWAERRPPHTLAEAIGTAQPFDLPYQGGAPEADRELQQLYGGLLCRALAAAYPPAPLSPAPRPGERVRVGVVSGFFRRHANWRIPVRGWVEGLDRSRFQLFGYHTGAQADEETAYAASLFERFTQGPLSTQAWRAEIVADRPHVLIYPETGMDAMTLRLASQRLAPVQAGSWGHPITSGLPTLDLYLSSDLMEPPGAERAYSERLVRLPGLSAPAGLETLPAPTAKRDLGLGADEVVIWCGQSPAKYLPERDHLFARIAARVAHARFVFIGYAEGEPLTARFRKRLHDAFAAEGVQGEAACLILPRLAPTTYLAAMGCADLVLDGLDWSGCNSLLDALAWRLPIVTMAGPTMRARHGAAILQTLGMEEAVARDKGDYVEEAVALALSPERRAAWRERLPADLPAALSRPDAVAALADVLIAAVRDAPSVTASDPRPS